MSVEELQASISTHVPVSSGLISLVVSTSDPDEAAQLANAIATELKNYTSTAAAPTNSNIKLTVIDPAIPADRPAGPRVLTTAAIGAAIGLVLAVSVAFLIENVRRPETEAGVPADA
jgi:capsular polysaccharide biosynthesis protein